MQKKFLLTLMLISPLVVLSTVNLHANEFQNCVDGCIGTYTNVDQKCHDTAFAAAGERKRCIDAALKVSDSCVEGCLKQYHTPK